MIAYDGHYVAADRLITNDRGMHGVTRKLRIFEKQVVVSCGAADHGDMLAAWFIDGKNPKDFPHPDQGGEKSAYLYVFGHNQPVMCFQTWPAPVLFNMREYAAGVGADIAKTAMHLGRDAREAVRIACELNVYCGGGIDYVDLAALAVHGKGETMAYAPG